MLDAEQYAGRRPRHKMLHNTMDTAETATEDVGRFHSKRTKIGVGRDLLFFKSASFAWLLVLAIPGYVGFNYNPQNSRRR